MIGLLLSSNVIALMLTAGVVPNSENCVTVVPVMRIQFNWLEVELAIQMRSSIGSSAIALTFALLLPAATSPVTAMLPPARSAMYRPSLGARGPMTPRMLELYGSWATNAVALASTVATE